VRRSVLVAVLLLSVGCQRTPAQSQTTSATPAKGATPGAQPAATGQTPAQPGQPGAEPAAPPAKPVPAQLPEVLAKVDTETISRADFEKTVRNIEARAGQPVPPTERDTVYRRLLDEMIDMRLVAHEGKARKVAVTDADVDTQMQQITKQFPSEEEFKKALASRNMTLEDLKTETRNNLLINKTLEAEILPKIAVQPADLETYYQANPDQFKQPEKMRASHILIPMTAQMTDVQKKEARTQAETVLKRAKAGEDFAALAKEFSKDSSAQNGGDLNFFPRGQMVPAFEAAAFALQPNQISEIVETPFGFHIIKGGEHQAASTVPLAQVTPQLTEFLKQQKQREMLGTFVKSLRGKYKVEVLI
jgi:peptidyl-prolyl cis-trans isomerase C